MNKKEEEHSSSENSQLNSDCKSVSEDFLRFEELAKRVFLVPRREKHVENIVSLTNNSKESS
jgi:hypothetical protein